MFLLTLVEAIINMQPSRELESNVQANVLFTFIYKYLHVIYTYFYACKVYWHKWDISRQLINKLIKTKSKELLKGWLLAIDIVKL